MKIHDFKRKKEQRQKIAMITCYDYPSARVLAESKVDCVLVGDSVAMAVHGYETTVMATLEMMVLHTQAVARGLSQQFLISDLPFLCHRASREETVHHVKALLQAGARGVKIEGGDADTCKTIAHLVNAGVPVMGHIGLTPQYVHQLGGYRVQGRNHEHASRLLAEAKALEDAGCFALVIECVPASLATRISKASGIPTIGIGAGNGTDGQVLVWHDLLGLQTELQPKFVKQFVQGKTLMLDAINKYVNQVQSSHFPSAEYAFEE